MYDVVLSGCIDMPYSIAHPTRVLTKRRFGTDSMFHEVLCSTVTRDYNLFTRGVLPFSSESWLDHYYKENNVSPEDIDASVKAVQNGIANIVFVGSPAAIEEAAKGYGLDITGIKIVDVNDAAIDERVGAKKVKRPSEVAGQANVLIFLDAAGCNVGTKLIQRFARCQVFGPLYQGFRLPILDCSRSDTDDILYNDIALLSVLAAYKKAK